MNKHTPDSANDHASPRSYIIGFAASLALTLSAYTLVTNRAFSMSWLLFVIATLAVVQLLVQLYYFLHLGSEPKPRWNLISFAFAALVVVCIVFGSIWIMYNLNYHDMSPTELDTHIIEDEGIRR